MFLSKLFIRHSAGPEGLPPVEGGAVEGTNQLHPRDYFDGARVASLQTTLVDRLGIDVTSISTD